jgi:hypothetical protein
MNNGLRDTNCKNGRVEIIPNDRRTWFAIAHLETKRFRGEGANNQVAINTDSTIFGKRSTFCFNFYFYSNFFLFGLLNSI